jgi:hypothetical protein
MNNGILCSFYGKSDDICDVGCGYISSSDVTMIIKFCSSNYRVCSKYQELTDRFPEEISREKRLGKIPPTPAASPRPQRPVMSHRPLIKPFKVKWPLPSLWRSISTNSFRDHRPFAGGVVEPITSIRRGQARSARVLANTTADPAPLGLLGFGMAIVLVNLHNAGFSNLSAFMLAMGIFFGGLLQIVTGITEWRRNNTFGATAFISYGMFWLTLVALMVMPQVGLGRAPSSAAVVAYLSMWGLFTAALFIGSLKLGRTLQIFFGLLTMLFVLLTIAGGTGNDTLRLVAGYQGILTGAMAIYAGMAKVVKDVFQGKPMTA